jgi:hypothetical protein
VVKKGESRLSTSVLMRDFVQHEEMLKGDPTTEHRVRPVPTSYDATKSDTHTLWSDLQKRKESAHILTLKRQELHSFLYGGPKSRGEARTEKRQSNQRGPKSLLGGPPQRHAHQEKSQSGRKPLPGRFRRRAEMRSSLQPPLVAGSTNALVSPQVRKLQREVVSVKY